MHAHVFIVCCARMETANDRVHFFCCWWLRLCHRVVTAANLFWDFFQQPCFVLVCFHSKAQTLVFCLELRIRAGSTDLGIANSCSTAGVGTSGRRISNYLMYMTLSLAIQLRFQIDESSLNVLLADPADFEQASDSHQIHPSRL